MRLIRTSDDRFAATRDAFAADSRHVQVPDGDGGVLRMATYSAGPTDAETVLLLHGEPTWSYLYRHVMTRLAERGLRAVAIDLVGFGRSDKPAEVGDHSYARHVEWVRAAVMDELQLRDVTLVGQDWGGLIGLRLATENPQLAARVVAANTGLPTGDVPMPEIWWSFRKAVEAAPVLDVGRFVEAGCRRGLSEQDRAAYDAPFPDEADKAGPRAMPALVPTSMQDPAREANLRAWERLGDWDRPFLVAFSDGDPITGAMAPVLRRHVPTAADQPAVVINDAGHFLQEDAGAALADAVVDFVDRTPTARRG